MTVNAQPETLSFQTEVQELLHLVTHSLYSNKEIFLRELISNASDAADKLRFEALSDSALYEKNPDLKIWIDVDKNFRTITVRDNGIGMSREEVIDNLGTIAKSGTKNFLEKLSTTQKADAHLIGQFGVGFYSAFVVADKVVVRTRRAGMQNTQGVYWESDGKGSYTVRNIEKPERGTEVILYIKKAEDEFLDEWRLRNIVTKYSDHIILPIVMKEEKITPADEKANVPETKEIKDVVVNRATALWTLPRSQVNDEEYRELYKHIAHDFEDPLIWSHNKVEGKLEYTSLLFIPSHAPFDLWTPDRRYGLKLYVQRVFIMDNAEQLLPFYLRFIRGIVDSNDLPLNVSREILQSNQTIESIRAAVVRRALEMLEKLSEDKEKYEKFWSAFGQVLKEGPAEDFANRDRIAKLLRFSSTHANGEEQTVSLQDYVSRMKSDQDKIYYVVADTFNAARHSPHLEIFKKKDIEVLLLHDRIDEWLVAHLTEFDGKKMQSVAKGDLDLKDVEVPEKKEKETEFEDVIKKMSEILSEKVKEVRLTYRLTDSPACLVSDENEMSAHLQRILQAAGQKIPTAKPIMEINPHHLIIKRLKKESEDRFKDWSHILFDQSLLAEGGQLEDPGLFVKRINEMFSQG